MVDDTPGPKGAREAELARDRLLRLITSYCLTQAIYCAAELEVADKLVEGPKSAEALAKILDCSGHHLFRLMRALSGVGVFQESDEGFSLTPLSQHLRKDVEKSLRPAALLHGHEFYTTFSKLLDNVRTGSAAWELAIGTEPWTYFAQRPERGALFDEIMRGLHDVSAIVAACDFSGANLVADIGGGDGSMLREVLTQYPSASGLLFDLPEVVGRAQRDPVWRDLAPRCKFVAGSFFTSVPGGADVYMLRHILHDWNDVRCIEILELCRSVMHRGARLLLIEALVGEGQRHWVDWADVGVMVLGGQERSAKEYEKLLTKTGFAPARCSVSATHVGIIETHVP